MDAMKTHIATSNATSITVRGRNLVHDLMGRHSFTDMIYFLLRGRMPTASQTRVLDACLVTLMEHGWTPTSIIARLAIDSVPGQAQVGIAAGLLAVGDVFVGTMEGAGRILAEGIAKPDLQAWCREVVADHRARRAPLPGFGHPFHKPDDPRPPRLFAIAQESGCDGRYISLLQQLSAESRSRHGPAPDNQRDRRDCGAPPGDRSSAAGHAQHRHDLARRRPRRPSRGGTRNTCRAPDLAARGGA
jgi:citrate synthase